MENELSEEIQKIINKNRKIVRRFSKKSLEIISECEQASLPRSSPSKPLNRPKSSKCELRAKYSAEWKSHKSAGSSKLLSEAI